MKALHYNYLLYGREIGDEGTPHLQGYVQLKTKLRRTALAKRVACFWEVARGDVSSQDYCKKSKDFVELGVPVLVKGAFSSRDEKIARNNLLLMHMPLNEVVSSGHITLKEVIYCY